MSESRDAALSVLQKIYGYPSFRGEQAEIIEHVISGKNAFVLMPTGGGKSLCYQIPALCRPGVGIVISPLIALMQDQVDALTQLGVRAAAINSSMAGGQIERVKTQIRADELDLVYVAPERLLMEDFLALLEFSEGAHDRNSEDMVHNSKPNFDQCLVQALWSANTGSSADRWNPSAQVDAVPSC